MGLQTPDALEWPPRDAKATDDLVARLNREIAVERLVTAHGVELRRNGARIRGRRARFTRMTGARWSFIPSATHGGASRVASRAAAQSSGCRRRGRSRGTGPQAAPG